MTEVGYSDIAAPEADTNIRVHLTVEGADERHVETVAIDLRARAVEVLRALDADTTPDDVEPHPMRIDWEARTDSSGGEP